MLRFIVSKFRENVVKVGFFAVVAVWLMVFTLPDGKLHVWFFDVGQGDAVFIQTPQNHQILIDGGPDRTVLSQLSKAMPFWDKSIDAIFVTHPHSDHITGVIEVLKNYQVERVFINPVVYDSPAYDELMSLVRSLSLEAPRPHFANGAKMQNEAASALKKPQPAQRVFLQGDRVAFGEVQLVSYWPPRQTSIFEVLDVNKASMVFRLDYGEFSTLFTGDAELSVQENPELAIYDWQPVDVLKVPHHGPKEALSSSVLEKLQPLLAVISVGKENKFGHPSQEMLDLLQGARVIVKRTDSNGTTEVISTGEDDYTVISEY